MLKKIKRFFEEREKSKRIKMQAAILNAVADDLEEVAEALGFTEESEKENFETSRKN